MISLPKGVHPRTATPKLIDYGFNSDPLLGGKSTRTDRPGNKFSISVELPLMRSKDLGRKTVARLIKAKTRGLKTFFPLNDFKPLNTGSPVTSGADQSGTSLIVSGFTPNALVKEGQFFSLSVGDDVFLHMVGEQFIADASGGGTVTFEPPLRAIIPDASPLEFARPVIQGKVVGSELKWELQLAGITAISFEVEETA